MPWDGLPLGDLSVGGLLAVTVLLILTGRLVPRSTYLDMREERDKWQKAHGISEEARSLQAVQTGELLEIARTTAQFVQSLPRPGP